MAGEKKQENFPYKRKNHSRYKQGYMIDNTDFHAGLS